MPQSLLKVARGSLRSFWLLRLTIGLLELAGTRTGCHLLVVARTISVLPFLGSPEDVVVFSEDSPARLLMGSAFREFDLSQAVRAG